MRERLLRSGIGWFVLSILLLFIGLPSVTLVRGESLEPEEDDVGDAGLLLGAPADAGVVYDPMLKVERQATPELARFTFQVRERQRPIEIPSHSVRRLAADLPTQFSVDYTKRTRERSFLFWKWNPSADYWGEGSVQWASEDPESVAVDRESAQGLMAPGTMWSRSFWPRVPTSPADLKAWCGGLASPFKATFKEASSSCSISVFADALHLPPSSHPQLFCDRPTAPSSQALVVASVELLDAQTLVRALDPEAIVSPPAVFYRWKWGLTGVESCQFHDHHDVVAAIALAWSQGDQHIRDHVSAIMRSFWQALRDMSQGRAIGASLIRNSKCAADPFTKL